MANKAQSEKLQPTLWRTCRVLANKTRLKVLNELCTRPEQRVTDIAQRLGLSLPRASQSLRTLNSRGLLLARRTGASVYYRLEADRSIRHNDRLVRAIRTTFSNETYPVRSIFRYATAFTHPRRILIVRALRERPLSLAEIASTTKISRRAIKRHLGKLEIRGFLKRANGWYFYSVPPHEFARVLLFLLKQV